MVLDNLPNYQHDRWRESWGSHGLVLSLSTRKEKYFTPKVVRLVIRLLRTLYVKCSIIKLFSNLMFAFEFKHNFCVPYSHSTSSLRSLRTVFVYFLSLCDLSCHHLLIEFSTDCRCFTISTLFIFSKMSSLSIIHLIHISTAELRVVDQIHTSLGDSVCITDIELHFDFNFRFLHIA